MKKDITMFDEKKNIHLVVSAHECLSYNQIYVETERKLADEILHKIHLKYDTQATVERIVADMKAVAKHEENMDRLNREINKTLLKLDKTEAALQEPIKMYLDGLRTAWRIMNGNK